MSTFNILGISGSLREESTNSGLLRCASEVAPEGVKIEIADLTEVPLFVRDLDTKPAPLQTLLDQMDAADAFLFACPEYNYSLAPALKNAIDWASRAPDNALLAGKPAAIMGAGGGMGTARAQYHLRQVCVFVDLHPLNKPEVFCNAFAGAFDEQGNVVDEKTRGKVADLVVALEAWAKRLRS